MVDAEPTAEKSIYYHMVRGTAWSVAMRWSIRAVGLVSTIILVRLLTPDDFGVMAIAALSLGMLEAFSSFGLAQLLIRRQDIDDAHYNTAWTIGLVKGLIFALIMVAGPPLAGHYFDDARAEPVIRWLALAVVVGSVGNIGILKARKELDFALEYRFMVYLRLLTFASTVGLAVLLRDYWALVFGRIMGRAWVSP